MAISTLPPANIIKRELAVACDCCCRMDEQVNWDTIFKSNISNDGIGGGGTRNWGGGEDETSLTLYPTGRSNRVFIVQIKLDTFFSFPNVICSLSISH